ncbi:MAG: hypothetical protein ACR2IF_06320 [Terriglobales bacterium]
MRRFLSILALVAVSVTMCLSAPQQSWSSSSPQDQSKDKDQSTQAPPPQHQSSSKQEEKKAKKEKKRKEKKDKSSGPQDTFDSSVFTSAVANSILTDLRDGLEGHSPRLTLSVFDQDKMDGYLTFEDQIESMFAKYSQFRVHFRISQATVEGPKGVALVDFELEEIPLQGGMPLRRNGQVRFEMERGRKGWKIVDFNPRGFFS